MVKEISRENRQTKSFGCHLMVSWKFPFTVIRIQEVKKSVLLQRAESSLILAISYRPKFSVLTKVLSYRPDLLYHLPESLSLASDSQIFFFLLSFIFYSQPLFSASSNYPNTSDQKFLYPETEIVVLANPFSQRDVPNYLRSGKEKFDWK